MGIKQAWKQKNDGFNKVKLGDGAFPIFGEVARQQGEIQEVSQG